MMRYLEPPPEFIQKYSDLYTEIKNRGGMTISQMAIYLGTSGGAATAGIASLEALGLYVWFEPQIKKYHVMRYEDEMMEVAR